LQDNPNISESGTATSAPAAPKKRPPLAQAARTFLKGVAVPSSVTHDGKEYFITEDEQESVVFVMTVMSLFAYGLDNGAPEMTVNVSRTQLAEIMHRSIRTVARRIALARILGLMRATFKGNCNEYVVAQKPCQHSVPADEVARWAKSRKSGPLELRNDTLPATTPSTEDTQLRNCVGGHPAVTPAVTPLVAQQESGEVCHANRDGVPRQQDGVPREQESRANVVSHSGVIPTGFSEKTGVVPAGTSSTPPASPATEVGFSEKTDDEWSDPLRSTPTVPADSSGKSGLVIQATKKSDLPECQICQQLAGHFSAGIIPDPKGKFCERHDNPMYR
jgi:hypothetical protein